MKGLIEGGGWLAGQTGGSFGLDLGIVNVGFSNQDGHKGLSAGAFGVQVKKDLYEGEISTDVGAHFGFGVGLVNVSADYMGGNFNVGASAGPVYVGAGYGGHGVTTSAGVNLVALPMGPVSFNIGYGVDSRGGSGFNTSTSVNASSYLGTTDVPDYVRGQYTVPTGDLFSGDFFKSDFFKSNALVAAGYTEGNFPRGLLMTANLGTGSVTTPFGSYGQPQFLTLPIYSGGASQNAVDGEYDDVPGGGLERRPTTRPARGDQNAFASVGNDGNFRLGNGVYMSPDGGIYGSDTFSVDDQILMGTLKPQNIFGIPGMDDALGVGPTRASAAYWELLLNLAYQGEPIQTRIELLEDRKDVLSSRLRTFAENINGLVFLEANSAAAIWNRESNLTSVTSDLLQARMQMDDWATIYGAVGGDNLEWRGSRRDGMAMLGAGGAGLKGAIDYVRFDYDLNGNTGPALQPTYDEIWVMGPLVKGMAAGRVVLADGVVGDLSLTAVRTAGSVSTESNVVRVFRVEGAPNARIVIGASGEVAIQGEKTLFLNFGDKARAEAFLAQRIKQGMSGTTIKSFQVPQSALTELQQSAVLESQVAANPGAPILVDVTKAPNQFGLRAQQIQRLQQQILQGSGKVAGE